jgi:hypothetical protein
MKKIVFSLLLVFGVLLLTGCGNIDFNKVPHIICTKTEDKVNDTTIETIIFAYDKNEKLGAFKVVEDVQYKTPMSTESMEYTAKTMKAISKLMGANFESEVGNNSFRYSFTGNIKAFKILMEKLDSNSNKTITGDTKQEALTSLTKEGFTCEDVKK